MNSANRAGKGAHTQRGFTISLDAVFALLIVITFIGFGRVVLFETQGTDTLAKLQAIQRADDVFTTMINTGSIWESLDEPGLTTGSIEDIYDKMDAQLPENIDFMITMRLYDSTIDADCRTSKDFKNCLSGVPFERSKGGNKPIQGDILHGRRVFVKKQPEPDCTYCGNGVCDDDEGENCSTCSGDCLPTGLECCLGIVCAFGETCVDDVCTPPGGFAPATFPFLGSSKIAHLEGEGMNLLLRTELAPEYSPADELDCDETENVHLEIEASAGEGRAPADIMMLLDRGEFMGRFLVKDSLINISHYCRDTWEVAGTFYNADFRSFQIVPDDPAIAFRLTDPSSETHLVNEGTFMKPTDIGIWTVECRKTGGGKTVNFSKYYRNIEAEQHSAVDFLSTASLKEPDQAGLVTFGTDVTLDAQLTTDEDAVITEIWAIPMPPGGGTNIAGAMNMAVDEFNTRGGEGYVRVAILMSDAAAEKGDVDGAIANAVANNVVFYTIAVGEGSDEGALQEIALGTSGEFWKITDTDTLDTVYALIDIEIVELTINGNRVDNPILYIPIPAGQTVLTHPDAEIVEEPGCTHCLKYSSLESLTVGEIWEADYSVEFPCSDQHSCEKDVQGFPEEGTFIEYIDIEENPGRLDWPTEGPPEYRVVDFDSRDLKIEFLGGKVIAPNQIYMNLVVENIDDLDTVPTDVVFSRGDTIEGGGEEVGSAPLVAVPGLCGPLNPPCSDGPQYYYDVYLPADGRIWAQFALEDGELVNEECPKYSLAMLDCSVGPRVQYYTLEWWLWPASETTGGS